MIRAIQKSLASVILAAVILSPPLQTGACPIISVNARRGDTVSTIAARYGSTGAAIRAANPGHALTPLMVGQTISVPACRRARVQWQPQPAAQGPS